jgi:hypothetical protein
MLLNDLCLPRLELAWDLLFRVLNLPDHVRSRRSRGTTFRFCIDINSLMIDDDYITKPLNYVIARRAYEIGRSVGRSALAI